MNKEQYPTQLRPMRRNDDFFQTTPQQHHQQQYQGGGRAEQQIQALSQKNHRLAKELSDLRVRHREETSVVSRLTMENMNLATRCREAIAQVASLKKELASYQQKQHSLNGEYDGLKREIGVLKRQIEIKNEGSNNIVNRANGLDGVKAAASGDNNEELSQPPIPANPTTDLDRIMSLEKFGGNKMHTPIEPSGSQDGEKEKNAESSSSAVISSNSKIPITIAPNNSSASNQNDDEFDADIDMVDFFTKQSTATSATTTAVQPNTKSLHHHVRKAKSNTDDVMPEDINGAGLGFSPEGKKVAVGDSLLSSLDAFEASFASAFPDTSFSINVSNSKETKMDITFDVPDFGEDPFFDNFKTPTPRTMVFDSTPVSFDDMSATSSSSNKGKKAKSRSALASLSPQSMSAEIEQLDAMAKNISDKSSGGDASLRATRKLRNVKQPVSYAEPSTKSKLRRGDVIFPKVDAQTKYQQSNQDKTTAVLKDLEETSASLTSMDLGKDP